MDRLYPTSVGFSSYSATCCTVGRIVSCGSSGRYSPQMARHFPNTAIGESLADYFHSETLSHWHYEQLQL